MNNPISAQALDLAIESAQLKAIKRVKNEIKSSARVVFDDHVLLLVMFKSSDVRFRCEIDPDDKFNRLVELVRCGKLVGIARGESAFFRLPTQRLHALSRLV